MTILPGSPELPMAGIKQAMTTRILECARGGFIVIYENHGVAACSTWDEVIDSIEAAGDDILGLKRMPLPRVIERAGDKASAVLNTLGMVLAGVGTAFLYLISVKIA